MEVITDSKRIWNLQSYDHKEFLCNSIVTLLNEKAILDVNLICEGTTISAHKLILASSSVYFRTKLINVPGQVIIRFDDSGFPIRYADLKKVIDFIYMGTITVPENRLKNILIIAKFLGVSELFELLKAVDKEICHTNKQNVTNDFSDQKHENSNVIQDLNSVISVVGKSENNELLTDSMKRQNQKNVRTEHNSTDFRADQPKDSFCQAVTTNLKKKNIPQNSMHNEPHPIHSAEHSIASLINEFGNFYSHTLLDGSTAEDKNFFVEEVGSDIKDYIDEGINFASLTDPPSNILQDNSILLQPYETLNCSALLESQFLNHSLYSDSSTTNGSLDEELNALSNSISKQIKNKEVDHFHNFSKLSLNANKQINNITFFAYENLGSIGSKGSDEGLNNSKSISTFNYSPLIIEERTSVVPADLSKSYKPIPNGTRDKNELDSQWCIKGTHENNLVNTWTKERIDTNNESKNPEIENMKINNAASISIENLTSKEQLIYTCNICKKAFESHDKLQSHEEVHKSNNLYKCKECHYSSTQKFSFVKHMANVHKMSASGKLLENKFHCSNCSFQCVSHYILKMHVLRKHGDKRFKCTECSYATVEKAALEKHLRIRHTGERPYMCETCGYSSHTLSGMARHRRSHLKLQPHECHQCGQRYADKKRLRDHLLKHSDLKPFVCNLCNYSCRRKDNLQSHVQKMHENASKKEKCYEDTSSSKNISLLSNFMNEEEANPSFLQIF